MAEENTSSPIAEISHEPSKFDSFLEQNQTKLIIIAILVTLLAIGALVFKGLGEMKDQAEGSQLAAAETEEEFRAVMGSGSDAVKSTAMLLLSDEQAKGGLEGKEAAIATLEELLTNYGTSEVAVDAKLRIARLMLDLGKLDESESKLKNILSSSDSGHTKVIAQAILADLTLQDGRLNESKKYYEESLENTKSASLRQLTTLGAKMAEVIPPTVIIKKKIIESEKIPEMLKNPNLGGTSIKPAKTPQAKVKPIEPIPAPVIEPKVPTMEIE